MALSFPLNTAVFQEQLPITGLTLDLSEAAVRNQTGAGEQITTSLAPSLWRGQLSFGVMNAAEADTADVLLDVLREGAGAPFELYDYRHPYPAADPNGAQLGSASVTISAAASSLRHAALAGLPAGYELRRGDYLSFNFDGTRRALHRVVDASVRATSAGGIAAVELLPRLRPSLTANTPVTLIKPSCVAVIELGSIQRAAARRGRWSGGSFSFTQTLRRV